jgi:hypothetical protein
VAATFLFRGLAIIHPRHVHVYDDNANFIMRMNLETMQPIDVLKVDSEDNTAFNGAKLSESVLGRDWNSPEEDAAWSNL